MLHVFLLYKLFCNCVTCNVRCYIDCIVLFVTKVVHNIECILCCISENLQMGSKCRLTLNCLVPPGHYVIVIVRGNLTFSPQKTVGTVGPFYWALELGPDA